MANETNETNETNEINEINPTKVTQNNFLDKLKEARTIIDEAEHTWGQPLYFDEEGNYVDIREALNFTLESIEKMQKENSDVDFHNWT